MSLANGENIKTVAMLMRRASSACTLGLYAGYVPNTSIGIGIRYMNFLRAAAEPRTMWLRNVCFFPRAKRCAMICFTHAGVAKW